MGGLVKSQPVICMEPLKLRSRVCSSDRHFNCVDCPPTRRFCEYWSLSKDSGKYLIMRVGQVRGWLTEKHDFQESWCVDSGHEQLGVSLLLLAAGNCF
jgi:hypothetical protein